MVSYDTVVRDVLQRMKNCLAAGRFTIRHRKEYMQVMEAYGLTYDDQFQMIENLTMDDYWRHDEDRKNPQYDIWIFKPSYCGNQMYVKFEIIDIDGEYVIFISAHPDQPGAKSQTEA